MQQKSVFNSDRFSIQLYFQVKHRYSLHLDVPLSCDSEPARKIPGTKWNAAFIRVMNNTWSSCYHVKTSAMMMLWDETWCCIFQRNKL